jgi:hypothetical protein
MLGVAAIGIPFANVALEQRRGAPILQTPALVFLLVAAVSMVLLSRLTRVPDVVLLVGAALCAFLGFLAGAAQFD